MQDRYYQREALDASYKDFEKVKQQLWSMATGTGKTVAFSQINKRFADKLPDQSLILAHRTELIDQAIDKMRNYNPSLKVDKEMAEHMANPDADVIVASVATLGRKGTKRGDRFNWERIDKIITDEAHHSTANSYMNIYEQLGVLRPDTHKLLLGVTATPNRADGKALAGVYKKIVYTYSMRRAIEDGWLVEVLGVRVNTNTSLDMVKTVAGDFAQDALANTVNTPQRNQLIAKAWLDNGQGRQTLGFTVDIQHAKDLAAMFQHYGVNASAVWGDDPDRAEKLAGLRNGTINVLFNCGVLTEGYDDWHIGCVILARPTKSGVLFTQMVGRGTRLQDGTGNLKEILATGYYVTEAGLKVPVEQLEKRDCIVIDVVDASSKHSLVTLPTLMGMNAQLDLRGKGVVAAVKMLEDAQKEYPNVNFALLKDLNELQAFIQSVNLFDIKFPPEVEANSELSWFPNATGGLILKMPNKEFAQIEQNLLEQWEISAIIKGQKYKGVRNTIEEAFTAADNLVTDKAWEHLKILKREEKWHKQPATTAQLKLLQKFYKGKQLPDDLDKGKASRLISSFLAGKA